MPAFTAYFIWFVKTVQIVGVFYYPKYPQESTTCTTANKNTNALVTTNVEQAVLFINQQLKMKNTCIDREN